MLENYPSFSKFTREELFSLMKFCGKKLLRRGEIVFYENETGNSMYIVERGVVKISKLGFLGETVLAQANPGDFVGEMAVVEGNLRSATASAMSDAELFELTRDKFEELKQKYPVVAVKLMDIILKLLSARLRATTKKVLKT
mgnify:CR=1 FL=1